MVGGGLTVIVVKMKFVMRWGEAKGDDSLGR